VNPASYVNVVSLFKEKESRSVDTMAKCYDDQDLLVGTIGTLTRGVLNAGRIRGKKVLIKPNWVRHSLQTTDELCLRTNDKLLVAAVDYILELQPSSIIIGDAPIQGCDWQRMLSRTPIEEITRRCKRQGTEVQVVDFRRKTFVPNRNKVCAGQRSMDEYVICDLGKDSFLEPITGPDADRFRVTDYDSDRMRDAHRRGVHKYCIARELFDADIVLSLPKVKTHQKAGITAALKNLVGLNGDKDFLPHHRLGGTSHGGDCYPGKNKLRYCAELAADHANRKQGKISYPIWRHLASLLWRASFPKPVHQMSAGWHGNDTTWRMVMDLNRIATHATADGKLCSVPVREIYSLCDGIIGGQGDGPLFPEPLELGCLSFSNNAYMTDLCWATMMGLEPLKVPLLIAAGTLVEGAEVVVRLNGQNIVPAEMKALAIQAKLPSGWIGYSSEAFR
jgi:uncharacterized protein (DUF362 family)